MKQLIEFKLLIIITRKDHFTLQCQKCTFQIFCLGIVILVGTVCSLSQKNAFTTFFISCMSVIQPVNIFPCIFFLNRIKKGPLQGWTRCIFQCTCIFKWTLAKQLISNQKDFGFLLKKKNHSFSKSTIFT